MENTFDFVDEGAKFAKFEPKVSSFGRKVKGAADIQTNEKRPGPTPDRLASPEQHQAALQADTDALLEEEAKFHDLTFGRMFEQGWDTTLTATLARLMSTENDPDWDMSDVQFKQIKDQFKEGLSEDQEQMLRRATSEKDFQARVERVAQEIDFGKRFQHQTGMKAAAGYATLFAGALADPAALPIGSFGVASRLVKGTGLAASTARGAAEGAIATGLVSPVLQLSDKGEVSGADLLQHMSVGAVFGGTMSAIVRGVSGKHVDEFATEQTNAMSTKQTDTVPEYESPAVKEMNSGGVVDFNIRETVAGPSGETAGAGPSAIIRAAKNWDEAVDNGATGEARRKWYTNPVRQKLTGWMDSEGVRLAQSKTKAARFVGSMWSGDQAGLGKQFSRNAAVTKEVIRDRLMQDTIPELKAAFTNHMTPEQSVKWMAGGSKDVQAVYSREVALEIARIGAYKHANGGKIDGYISEAPATVQAGARIVGDNFAATRKLHIESGTDSAAMLKDADPYGYLPQRPNYAYLARAEPEVRKAHLDMLKETYKNEADTKIRNLKAEKEAWMERAYQRAERDIDNPWVNEFLANPDKYFDDSMELLSQKIYKEMDNRASRYWDNALKDPNARYQSSEATLLQLSKELSAEHFEGRYVDKDILDTFAKNLTDKWSDKSRRDMNMLMERDVNGKQVYMLDMFNHDVFDMTANNINSTAGRVSMAKLGWKTEQDIQDTLQAMRIEGAAPREVESAQFISDVILGRAPALDDAPLTRALSNFVHSAMMGKLGMSVAADIPTMVGNLGVSGLVKAMGPEFAKKAFDGSLFHRHGKLTKLGSDLEYHLQGMMGHDSGLWLPSGVTSDGMAMDMNNTLLRVSEAGARVTNSMSGANAVSKMLGSVMVKATTDKLHNFLSTGRGISTKRLADVGLHKKELARIQEQFNKHKVGKEFGLDRWTDPVAKEDFIAAAHRFTQQSSMNKNYAGDQHKGERTNLIGVLYSRFRSIGARAQERVFTRNLTLADGNAVAMFTTGLAWAYFLSYARIHIDAATSKDPQKVLKDRLNPIGLSDQAMRFASIMGLASEGTNLLQIVTGGSYQGGSDTPMTGAVSNFTGAFGAVGKAMTGEGEWSKAGQATMKILPGANTYQMMLLQRQLDD